MPPKIIGAGLGRNGTMSTRSALIKLGFTKCYHMAEILQAPNTPKLCQQWHLAYQLKWAGQREACKKLLKELLDDYDATLDHPASDFYEELSEMYPEAIVLLNHRDNAESYAKSVATSIGVFMEYHYTFVGKFIQFFKFEKSNGHLMHRYFYLYDYESVERDFDYKNFRSEEHLVKYYNYWLAKVEKYFSSQQAGSGRLLKFNVKQGWQPICDKLNLKIPNEPFPRVNDSEHMKKNIKMMKTINGVAVSFFLFPIVLAFFGKYASAVVLFLTCILLLNGASIVDRIRMIRDVRRIDGAGKVKGEVAEEHVAEGINFFKKKN